ncbi:MAG TPA: zf-HC2 domain-containing protein [Casimicrobiaceae bacterium]
MSGRVVQFDPAAHKVADVLLPWLVNGTLEGEELAFVQQHIATCARCQREVEWLREFHAACVAGESEPSTSSAFRSLRRKLETRPKESRFLRWRNRWRVGRSWTRWVIAAQVAIIAVLGTVVVTTDDQPALYRTLAAGDARVVSAGSLVVVFDPATTEADLRRMLRDVGARLIDGPTRANAYVLEVPETRREQAVRVLRNERAVVLVENLGPKANR